MKRLLAAMTAALLMVALVSSAAVAAAPGNSLNAKACQKGGYLTLIGATGQTFATQSACVSYASGGGILYPKTPTLTNTFTGPVPSVGALVSNPQSRVAGGITDPAMQFNLSGTGWVPGATISLTYTAAAPLGYTYANPTAYMAGAGNPYPVVATGAATFAAFFQDNCFDNSNQLVKGLVSFTITGTDTLGQSASYAGQLNCDLIPATVVATANTLDSHAGFVLITASGWHFTPNTPITLTYNVPGASDGGPLPASTSALVTDATGAFTWASDPSLNDLYSGYWGDNCIYTVGGVTALQTSDMTFTMTAFDGTHTATATGVLKCSLLAP
jgi:hypothetical protein